MRLCIMYLHASRPHQRHQQRARPVCSALSNLAQSVWTFAPTARLHPTSLSVSINPYLYPTSYRQVYEVWSANRSQSFPSLSSSPVHFVATCTTSSASAVTLEVDDVGLPSAPAADNNLFTFVSFCAVVSVRRMAALLSGLQRPQKGKPSRRWRCIYTHATPLTTLKHRSAVLQPYFRSLACIPT